MSRRLKRDFGSNLLAVGIRGSVARGTAEKFSDVDLLVILQRFQKGTDTYSIVSDTYCSLNFETWKSAISKLREPHPELPETLGGFTKFSVCTIQADCYPGLWRKLAMFPKTCFGNPLSWA